MTSLASPLRRQRAYKVFPDEFIAKPAEPKVTQKVMGTLMDFTQKILQFKNRLKAKKGPKMIIIDHPSNKWSLEKMGGLGIWVNQSTNDVSIERPTVVQDYSNSSLGSKSERKKSFKSRKESRKPRRNNSCELFLQDFSAKQNDCHYSDVEELFQMIDASKSSQRIKTIAGRRTVRKRK